MVVNTCAFIEAARQESIDTILELSASRRRGRPPGGHGMPGRALRRRAGDGLARGRPGGGLRRPGHPAAAIGGRCRRRFPVPGASSRLRPSEPAAAGRERAVGVCQGGRGVRPALWVLRHPVVPGPAAVARPSDAILAEVDALGGAVREIVLVAQDLASWGLDRSAPSGRRARRHARPIVELIRRRGRAGGAGAAALPLPLGARRRRWSRRSSARGVRVLRSVAPARVAAAASSACAGGATATASSSASTASGPSHRARHFARRSSSGYPGETEEDHDALLAFLDEAQLDWAGFFTFSRGTGHLRRRPARRTCPPSWPSNGCESAPSCRTRITAERRAALVGDTVRVLVDTPGTGRSYREAPEIDGVVHVPPTLGPGRFHDVVVTGAAGPDLWAEPSAGAGAGGVAGTRRVAAVGANEMAS